MTYREYALRLECLLFLSFFSIAGRIICAFKIMISEGRLGICQKQNDIISSARTKSTLLEYVKVKVIGKVKVDAPEKSLCFVMFILYWKRVPPNKSCSQAYRALHQRIGVKSIYE